MEPDYSDLIEQSIQMELNMADLYLCFHRIFPEDEHFWWQLVLEEKNHAALLRSGNDVFRSRQKFPPDLLSRSVEDVRLANEKICALVQEYAQNPPSRETAFQTAHELENAAAELHFQQFMEKVPGCRAEEIFQDLNGADKDHAARILAYMQQHQPGNHE